MKTKLKYSVHISLQQTHSAHVNNMKSESKSSCFPRTFEKPVGFDEIDDNSWTIGLQVTPNPLSICRLSGFLVQLSLSGTEVRSATDRILQGRGRQLFENDASRCQTFHPKAGSFHASSPHILSAPNSVRRYSPTPFSYVVNVADVINSKRGYSPCNIEKMRNSHVTAINQTIASNKSLM